MKAKELIKFVEMEKEFPKPDPNDELYVEYDKEYGAWLVLGTESGHAYASYGSEEEANRKAKEMSQKD